MTMSTGGRGRGITESKSTMERQKEILDAAEKLFSTKGYDATSVTDIMKVVGIAKGTLYYHFSSKEEILDALITRIVDHMEERANYVVKDHSLSICDKLVGIILSLNVNTHGEGHIIKTLHNPQNALFHQKSVQLVIDRISPILTMIVKEGIKEGIFHTEYPKEVVRMLMTYSMNTFEDGKQISEEMIHGFIYNVERLLGTEHGFLHSFYKVF